MVVAHDGKSGESGRSKASDVGLDKLGVPQSIRGRRGGGGGSETGGEKEADLARCDEEDVDVLIMVSIQDLEGGDARDVRGNDVLGAETKGPCAVLVFDPRELGVIDRNNKDVEITVAVGIGDHQVLGRVCFRRHQVLDPGRAVVDVFVPQDEFEVGDNGNDNVDVSISVQVGSSGCRVVLALDVGNAERLGRGTWDGKGRGVGNPCGSHQGAVEEVSGDTPCQGSDVVVDPRGGDREEERRTQTRRADACV